MTLYISPYRRMASIRQAMDRLLEDSFGEYTPGERDWSLAVDVTNSEEGYTIKALVPGLNAEDLNIEVLNNTVTIRGEFKSWEKEDEKYLVSELPCGSFSRVLTLPTTLDAAKAEASIENGVLTFWVPKAEAHRPKTIKVAAK